MNPSIKLEPRNAPALTAQLRFAVRLLRLSSLDYEQALSEMAGRNPFLDCEDPVVPEHAAAPEAPTEASTSDDRSPADGSAEPGADAPDRADDGDPWLQASGGTRDGARADAPSPLELTAAEVDLRQHLRAQAGLLRLSPRDRTLVVAIIESLDDDGYLRTPLEEIAALAGGEPQADPSELSTALKLVQSLEPSGVAARSVAECLRLQLAALPTDARALASRILDEQLERLARSDAAGIARALGEPLERIETLCAAIRRLDPRPARRFDRQLAPYVVPEVIVRKSRGRWSAELNPAAVPRVALNQSYAELFRSHRDRSHRALAGQLEEARWTVRNVEQRFATILSVAQSILKHQYAFFDHGPIAMKPLGLGDVAAEVGVHESTVCRATNHKYLATPAGVFELRSFFSRSMPLASGGAATGVAIRELVREMIEDEDRSTAALSDGDITRRLGRQGITVTRRTVTKYRAILGLPAAAQRQQAGREGAVR